jgi:hypothetical protein
MGPRSRNSLKHHVKHWICVHTNSPNLLCAAITDYLKLSNLQRTAPSRSGSWEVLDWGPVISWRPFFCIIPCQRHKERKNLCVCVCVCVCERERERKRDREAEREKRGHTPRFIINPPLPYDINPPTRLNHFSLGQPSNTATIGIKCPVCELWVTHSTHNTKHFEKRVKVHNFHKILKNLLPPPKKDICRKSQIIYIWPNISL